MDSNQMRVWIRQILEVIKTGATLTSTNIDDQAVEMMLRAIDNDLLWAWIAKLIDRFMKDDDPLIVAEEEPCPVTADAAAINPLMIIAIVKAIVELWKAFR
jgi:hypothetical protein